MLRPKDRADMEGMVAAAGFFLLPENVCTSSDVRNSPTHSIEIEDGSRSHTVQA
jgi:hypothetical protein